MLAPGAPSAQAPLLPDEKPPIPSVTKLKEPGAGTARRLPPQRAEGGPAAWAGPGEAAPLPPVSQGAAGAALPGHVPGPRRSVPAELAPSSLPGSRAAPPPPPPPPSSRRSAAMNIFRLTGDLSHLAAIIILLLKIWKSRSCAGACGGGRPRREGGRAAAAEGSP